MLVFLAKIGGTAMNPEHCTMKWVGNVRKMSSVVNADGRVNYVWRGKDVLDDIPNCVVNEWIGQEVRVSFEGVIHCVETGKVIKKTYGEGLSYDAFLKSPLACPSIIRPELSRIHEGIALRDEEWERAHHLTPHVVYLSQTSHVKVGVTRKINVPSRWVDQGAVSAVVLAEAPYRQLAGEIEVALKEVFSDRTHWRNMLKPTTPNSEALLEAKDQAFGALGMAYETFFEDEDHVHTLHFPVLQYPEKVTSTKLVNVPVISGKLVGVKGQYWIWEDGTVWNVRAHAGSRVAIDVS